jgi:hypothetical protein
MAVGEFNFKEKIDGIKKGVLSLFTGFLLRFFESANNKRGNL